MNEQDLRIAFKSETGLNAEAYPDEYRRWVEEQLLDRMTAEKQKSDHNNIMKIEEQDIIH